MQARSLFWKDEKPVSIGANHSGCANASLDLLMLMTMKEKLWLCRGDVVVEADKASVNFIVTVVNKAWGVVSHENIHCGERRHCTLNFGLLKKEISSRFVFPRPAETTKRNVAKLKLHKMQVSDWRMEWSAGVMVTLNCQDFTTTTFFGCSKNHFIRQVTTGNQDVRMAVRNAGDNQIIVSDDKQVHRERNVASPERKRDSFWDFGIS